MAWFRQFYRVGRQLPSRSQLPSMFHRHPQLWDGQRFTPKIRFFSCSPIIAGKKSHYLKQKDNPPTAVNSAKAVDICGELESVLKLDRRLFEIARQHGLSGGEWTGAAYIYHVHLPAIDEFLLEQASASSSEKHNALYIQSREQLELSKEEVHKECVEHLSGNISKPGNQDLLVSLITAMYESKVLRDEKKIPPILEEVFKLQSPIGLPRTIGALNVEGQLFFAASKACFQVVRSLIDRTDQDRRARIAALKAATMPSNPDVVRRLDPGNEVLKEGKTPKIHLPGKLSVFNIDGKPKPCCLRCQCLFEAEVSPGMIEAQASRPTPGSWFPRLSCVETELCLKTLDLEGVELYRDGTGEDTCPCMNKE